ncbi:tryptophan-rich sensory protein [bacterium]|nr:tryptophan-rich sensory protein [bacterium]MDB4088279.1 tryptophan-rich sensory protein [Flavobacteriales bacterium]
MIKRVLIFLVINFIALGIGGFFTGPGVSSEWFLNLNQAPWNPPGWVFGAAWTFIMVCFAFFMAYWWSIAEHKKGIAILFGIQWVLNVSWNIIFFYSHEVTIGLIVISSLTLLVGNFLFNNWKKMGLKSLLVAPYFIWLLIATSLNAYILFNN